MVHTVPMSTVLDTVSEPSCAATISRAIARLAVLTNYPAELGLEHGAGICRTVAQQLFGAGS